MSGVGVRVTKGGGKTDPQKKKKNIYIYIYIYIYTYIMPLFAPNPDVRQS